MQLTPDTEKRLEKYLIEIGEILKYPKRKAAFATYIIGLFSMAERKTAESLAAMSVPDPTRTDAEHQRLLHVIGQSKWSDRPVRRHAASTALDAMTSKEDVESWILDDTGWVKKGNHSVGVQRQYTGTSGKVDNCQLGVSLVAATRHWQVPLDFELYLPESWTDDKERRQRAKIPDDVEFQTKTELGLAMIDKAIEDGMPLPRIVLADSFYGRSGPLRSAIRQRRLHYGVGVRKNLQVRRLDANGIRRGPTTSADAIARKVKFRRVTWVDGSQEKLWGKFACVRVIPQGDLDEDENAKPVWLVIEKTCDCKTPYKFHLSSMPKTTTRKELVRLIQQRWRTERVYQDLKQEFGMDHYQGRSFVGWHHHVTAAMVCHAFTVAEQTRLFPPRATFVATSDPKNRGTTSAPFCRIHSYDSTRDTSTNTAMAFALPFLPSTDAQTGQVCLRSNVTQ